MEGWMMSEKKKQLRQEVKLLVENLDEAYCRQTDAEILERVTSLPEYVQAETVFCFVGRRDEIDTVPILTDAWKRGKRVCVPKCAGKGLMDAYLIRGMDDLQAGSFGILEPGDHAKKMMPEEIDLVLVPCLSCSRSGKRLGYGGGYYDRYLEKVTAPKAVLCRSRVMREDIPVEDHDLTMDLVISEDYVGRPDIGLN